MATYHGQDRTSLLSARDEQLTGSRSSKPLLQLLNASTELRRGSGCEKALTLPFSIGALQWHGGGEAAPVQQLCLSWSCDLRQAKWRCSFLNCCSLVGVQINSLLQSLVDLRRGNRGSAATHVPQQSITFTPVPKHPVLGLSLSCKHGTVHTPCRHLSVGN